MSTSRVFTVGQVLTAAQMNDLPQGILGKTTVTANVTGITTEVDVITAPAVTIAGTGRRIRITFHARGIESSVGDSIFYVSIKEGATVLQQSAIRCDILNGNGVNVGTFSAIVDSPTAASHTYKATAQRVGGTGTGTLHASATAPITLTVEDAGQV